MFLNFQFSQKITFNKFLFRCHKYHIREKSKTKRLENFFSVCLNLGNILNFLIFMAENRDRKQTKFLKIDFSRDLVFFSKFHFFRLSLISTKIRIVLYHCNSNKGKRDLPKVLF